MPKKRRTKKQEQVEDYDDPESGNAPAQVHEVEVDSVKNVPRARQSSVNSDLNNLESCSSSNANDVVP